MAFITISGYPASGKTKRATQLKEYLETRLRAEADSGGPKWTVKVHSDDSLGIPRSVYDDSRTEKPARSALLTAIVRDLSANTILIADAPNYIKGFRYQAYCAAREVGVRVCSMYVVATPDMCREWNSKKEDAYAPATFENMIARYEEPSSMVRWDSPLFTVPWSDEDIPGDGIWQVLTTGNVKPANQAVAAIAKAPTDALQTLEQTSTFLVTSILSNPAAASGLGGSILIPFSPSSQASTRGPKQTTLSLEVSLPPRHITISELQRHRRQFVAAHRRAITQGLVGNKGSIEWGEEAIARKFIAHLEEHLNV